MPRRALHILEGESLFNDASGLVCFKFAVAAVLTGIFSFTSALWTLLWAAVAGISLGIATTISIESIKIWLGRYIEEDVGTHILISLLIPFAAYLLAEHVHSSGILAVVAAGVTMSYSEASGRAQALTRLQRRTIWDMLKFTLNGILFVLLGEQFPALFASAAAAAREAGHQHISWLLLAVMIITLALIALRFIWGWLVMRLTWLLDHTQKTARHTNWRILLMMSVAGVRGAVTLAGVLTLPLFMPDGSAFPTRDLAIFIAGGVIILSLIMASVSIPWLLQAYTFEKEPPALAEEIQLANQASQQAALAKLASLNEQYRNNAAYQQALTSVLQAYQKVNNLQPLSVQEKRQLEKVHKLSKHIKRQVLNAIVKLARERQISDDCMRHLIQHLDLLEIQL
jgi:CPA1 family monovalent cation:H+ antiporter